MHIWTGGIILLFIFNYNRIGCIMLNNNNMDNTSYAIRLWFDIKAVPRLALKLQHYIQ